MHDELDEASSTNWEEYWRILQRRRWWILLPLFVCWGVIWGVSWVLPVTFRSEALIIVEQQEVPEQYVVPNISVSLQDRLQSMTQQILSRTRLQSTIDRFRLYPKRRLLSGVFGPDDPVEQMRKDINIELVEAPGHPGELRAFKIAYSASSRELAQRVNSELTSLFIDENLKSQQQQSENTTAFLESQLSAARAQLQEQEEKVRTFKAKHFGDLPSQLETNVQILSGLQAQLNNNQRALDAAKQQKLYLESLLQQYGRAQGDLGSDGLSESSEQSLDKELLDLRTRLADARSRYTESYPDVVALKEKLAETEKLKTQIADEVIASRKSSTLGVAGSDIELASVSAPVMQVRSQLKANQLEISNYEQHASDIESQIATYRSRLNLTPETEQELADISRGYDESKANYNSLLQKQNQSQLATSLEQRQQGEQFRIIDPPSLPTKPSSPNHLLISGIGLVVGTVMSLGLIAVLELKDHRVWCENDLTSSIPGRVLVGIPRLKTAAEDHNQMIRKYSEVLAAAAIIALIAAANWYAFLKG